MTQEDFIQYHKYLFVIAYNILGDIPTAEDIVQDTYEKWLGLDRAKINDVRSYLSKITVNKAIDTLKRLKQEKMIIYHYLLKLLEWLLFIIIWVKMKN